MKTIIKELKDKYVPKRLAKEPAPSFNKGAEAVMGLMQGKGQTVKYDYLPLTGSYSSEYIPFYVVNTKGGKLIARAGYMGTTLYDNAIAFVDNSGKLTVLDEMVKSTAQSLFASLAMNAWTIHNNRTKFPLSPLRFATVPLVPGLEMVTPAERKVSYLNPQKDYRLYMDRKVSNPIRRKLAEIRDEVHARIALAEAAGCDSQGEYPSNMAHISTNRYELVDVPEEPKDGMRVSTKGDSGADGLLQLFEAYGENNYAFADYMSRKRFQFSSSYYALKWDDLFDILVAAKGGFILKEV